MEKQWHARSIGSGFVIMNQDCQIAAQCRDEQVARFIAAALEEYRGSGPVALKDRLEDGRISKEEAIKELGRSFPCFQDCPDFAAGVPWDPDKVHGRWQKLSSGELHAMRFILAVWAPDQVWACGRFDAIDACASWDREHRDAFATWAMDSWWPYA
jgi:hypothetical protein